MTHFKVGLLALVAVAAVLATSLALGLRALRTDTIAYHTYFDESVQGLELGSPVKYRGVRIGNVAKIAIAPDRKHVDVVLALNARDAERLGLAATLPELRTQLGNQGITGVKYVDIDFFDPAANPPQALPFEPAASYIPARPSLFKGLEDNLEAVGQRLPELVDRADATLGKLGRAIDDVHDEQVARRIAEAADAGAGALADVRKLARHVDAAKLQDRASAALDRVADAAARVDAMIARLDGERGLVASARRATDSIGDLGKSTLGSTEELERTIRELGDAARAVRELAETIDRDPDMLVKGRARSGKK
jgi:phospholipid/cholesterol/gamma-HCH transport system substrate-binding protein